MHRLLATFVFLAAAPVAAEEWRPLTGGEIRDALTGRTVDYDAASQDFRSTGRTLYNAGADSWGMWRVENDRYCSQWPPNSRWDCYDVDLSADGGAVRFRGLGDDVSIGRFRGGE